MPPGYVYVLFNPSFLDLVKIGRTARSSEERAAEISRGTGVPTPYVVAYEAYAGDCDSLEAAVHAKLANYRIAKDREFFRIPLKEAITIVQQAAVAAREAEGIGGGPLPPELEISPRIRAKYGTHVRPEITSIRITQSRTGCYLLTTSKEYPHSLDELTLKTDLGFIVGEDAAPMFQPSRSLQENADVFLSQLSPYDLIMCTDLFTPEAAQEIADRYELGGA